MLISNNYVQRTLYSLLALIFVFNISIFAQNQTGGLRGQITDEFGAIVIGATVTANNNAGVERTTQTDNNGEYNITNLPIGVYTVRAVAENFAQFENTEVNVVAGQRQQLNISLTVTVAAEEVSVGGEEGVTTEPDNNASATVLSGRDLESLPEDPDELAAALQALAGPSAGPNGGQFFIDGFTGGRLPPRESIREVRINQNPFSSEYDRPGFGRVEIFTKPGADKLRGQGFFNFNDEVFNSRDPFAANRAPSQLRFYGGNLSGPIIKNKASFFFDIDNRESDENSVVNAQILDQTFTPTLFNQAFVVPRRRFSVSPRFDYAINDRNTLIARYSFQRNTIDNTGFSGQSLPSQAVASENTEHTVQLTETAVLSANIVNETRFQYVRGRGQTQGDLLTAINVLGAFSGGGSNIGLNLNNDDRFELQNYTSWTIGKHALRFGGRLRHIQVDSRAENNFGGTFSFLGVPFRTAANAQGVVTPLDAPIRLVDGTVVQRPLNSLEQYRERLLGNTDPRFNPNQYTVTIGDPLASISQTDLGVFLNDDWRVRQDLTLSFGLRYEAQSNVSSNINFAPRVGFAYSPGAGGARQPKTVFRGGFGVFYDRISENLSLQEFRFDGSRQIQYFVTDPTLLGQPVFTLDGVTNAPSAAQIAALVPGSSTVRQLEDGISSPYTMQGAISVERQLPFRSTVSFTYLLTGSRNLLRSRNINAPVCPPGTICPTDPVAVNQLRPDPTAGNIFQFESNGRFNQQQFLVNFNTRLNPNFSVYSFYRLGFAKSDVDGGGGGGFGFGGAGAGNFPQYSYDLSGEYGRSFQDIRHFAVLGGSFGVPFGIRLSPFIQARSGTPFNITRGVDVNRDTLFLERPAFANEQTPTSDLVSTRFGDFDVNPKPGQIIVPRNYGRGPGFFTFNLNAFKTFGFGGSRRNAATGGPAQQQPEAPAAGQGRGGRRGGGGGIPGVGGGGGGRGGGGFGQFSGQTDKPYNLTLGVQILNLFNTTNEGQPVGNLNSPLFGESFGIVRGFGGGGASVLSGNRNVVLQARFSF